MDRKELMERFPAITASVIATWEGAPLEANLPDGISTQTFAIMCATVMGAAATASHELGGPRPDRITIQGEKENILIIDICNECVLACAVSAEEDIEPVFEIMKKVEMNIII